MTLNKEPEIVHEFPLLRRKPGADLVFPTQQRIFKSQHVKLFFVGETHRVVERQFLLRPSRFAAFFARAWSTRKASQQKQMQYYMAKITPTSREFFMARTPGL
jgi:hypothetical protein